MPIVADAAVAVRGDLSQFNKDLAKGADQGATKAGQSFGQKFKAALSPKNLAVAGVAAGAAIGAAVIAGLADAARSLIDIERLNAQTDAAIRATGGVANVTRDHIEDMAEGLESLTTTERETVQEGANLLLTFKRIRNEAGEGNDIFDQATATALDLSVALGTDMRSASMMLGKALDDPIRGVTALRRAGVALTEQQQEQIKAFVEAGDVLSAQKMILAELESQVGGSAEAFANTTAGKIQRFQNDVGNMFESIVLGAAKVADSFGDAAHDIDVVALHFGDLGDRANGMADRFGTTFDDIKKKVRTRMNETGESVTEALDAVEDEFYKTSNEIPATMDEGMRATHQVVVDRGAEIRAAWEETSNFIPQAIRDKWDDTRRAAFQITVEHAKGILDGQNQVKVAFEVLTQLQEEEQTKAQRISYLQGVLSSQELADGLKDGRPGVRGAANALRAQVVAELASLGVNAYNSGYSIGAGVAQGIYASAHLADGASSYLAAKISGYLPRSEPKEGPLRGITKVGDAIVHSITDGIYRNLGTASSATAMLAGALVPSFSAAPLALAGAGAVGAGNTYVLQVEGKEPLVGSREDVLDGWESLTRARIGGM